MSFLQRIKQEWNDAFDKARQDAKGKPQEHHQLSAKIIVGSEETAKKLGVPIGTEVDLGVISETYSDGFEVKGGP